MALHNEKSIGKVALAFASERITLKTFDTSKSATKAIEGTPNKPNPALSHSTNAILVGIFLTLLGGAFWGANPDHRHFHHMADRRECRWRGADRGRVAGDDRGSAGG